ncbi:MAG: hypothetical protein KAI29_22415, partial [Cyclobacteriaceae bacterium]|nr:hypothetical protein [Cyclobacteriaceae bacterium]
MQASLVWPGDLIKPDNPIWLNLNKHSLLRIEGHVNKLCDSVFNTLNDLRHSLNIEFDILKLNMAASPPVPVDPELVIIEDLIVQIEDIQRQIEDEISTGMESGLEAILALFMEMELIRKDIIQENENWQKRRLTIKAPCNISFLKEDYLTLRSEMLCMCAKINSVMSGIPDIGLTDEKKSSITMDEKEVGQKFGEESNAKGEKILEKDGVSVTLEAFRTKDGNQVFKNANIKKAPSDFRSLRVIQMKDMSLKYDFSKMEYKPRQVIFNFKDGGGAKVENISVNGSNIYTAKLGSVPVNIAEGVTYSVTSKKVGGKTIGTVTLTGNIESLVIGGEDLIIDKMEVSSGSRIGNNFSRKNIKERDIYLNERIAKVKNDLKNATSESEKQIYLSMQNSLEKEKVTLGKMDAISEKSGIVVNAIYL